MFRQLFPGAQIAYSVVAIEDAFPKGHHDYEGKALEAVRCEIIFADGTYIVAFKEIDLREYVKGGWKDRPQTPENLAKDETKCLGRALRDAGVPQRLSELKILMQWQAARTPNISSFVGAPLTKVLPMGTAEVFAEAFPGTTEEIDDSPDAGSEDPTPEQLLAKRFAFLDGPQKADVVRHARETLDVNNVLRAGEHAEALMNYIEAMSKTGEILDPSVEAHNARAEERRAEAAASLLPEEEPFLSLGEQRDGYRNQEAP